MFLHKLFRPTSLLYFLAPLVLLAPFALAQDTPSSIPASLSISGDIPTPLTLTAEDLSKFPRETASLPEHEGRKSTCEGAALAEVLKKAGAPSGGKLRGNVLASYVLAVARDGYQVTFTLAELDSDFKDSVVIVADKCDGKPLSSHDGPLRLVAGSDKKAARSVRMLDKLQIVLLRKEESKAR